MAQESKTAGEQKNRDGKARGGEKRGGRGEKREGKEKIR
jgi:hypothetical protein